jgi:uncharacterized membrane protein
MTPDTPPAQTASPDPSADPAPARAPGSVVAGLRAATLGGLLALIALGVAWELWLAPTGRGTLAIKVLPLVFCVAGLLRHRMYTFRWLSLLVWLYFLEGTVRATTEHGLSQALAVGEVALSVWLFCCSASYIRLRLRQARPIGEPVPQ